MILSPWNNKHLRVLGGFEYLHADNVEADPGTGGATFRTDDIGSNVQVPYAKLMDGRDGATGVIPGDATNGLFVNVTTSVLPTGGATAAAQATSNTALSAIQTAVEALDNAVSGSELQVDIVTSALPTGAATAARQPGLGTAGTASADVITVQGVTSMTPLLVNGSGVTQPISDAGASVTTDTPQLPGTLGQKAMTASLAVVLASDQASIPVTVATIPSHAVTNAGTFATQVDGAALTALQLLDNLVLAEDAAHSTGDPGLMPLAVRRDANTTLVGADGDYAPLQVNADGSLKVAITAGAGSGGTSSADDSAFSVGSGSGTPIMGLADEAAPDAVDEGDVGVVRMTLSRGLHVNLRDASGAEVSVGGGTQYDEDTAHTTGDKVTMAGVVRRDANTSLVGADGDIACLQVNAGGQLKVDGSAVTQPVSNAGTFAVQNTAALPAGTNNIGDVDVLSLPAIPAGNNNIGDVDIVTMPNVTLAAGTNTNEVVGDAAHDAAAAGNPILVGGYASAAAPADVSGDADAVRAWHLRNGAAATVLTAAGALIGGDATNGLDVDVTRLPGAAHDAAISGNPLRIGGRAMTADYAAVATGDTVDLMATINGKLVVKPHALPGEYWNYAAPAGGLVSTTAVTVKTAAGSGIRNYVTSAQIINSHATISTELMILDGAAGTVLWRGWIQAAGGGVACQFDPPLRGTANTLVEIDEVTATATTGVLVNLQGFEAEE